MINLIKSEGFLLKRFAVGAAIIFVVAYIAVFLGGLDVSDVSAFSVEALAKGSTLGILLSSAVVACVIAYGYLVRIQLYEIMAGYKPSVILLSRAVLFVSLIIMVYLLPVGVVLLIVNSGSALIKTYLLFSLLCLRFCLCTVFLSSFLKEGAWATLFWAFVLLIKEAFVKATGSADSFRKSFFGLTTFGQSCFLAEPITGGFATKVVISSVVSCVICYLIGYFVLKKKCDLESHSSL